MEDTEEMSTSHVGLFFDGHIPVPGEPVLLRFFERRYITMVNTALEGSRKFG